MRWLSVVFAAVSLLSFGSVANAAEGGLTQTKLPNGLRVVVDENHRVPVVSVTVRYAVGMGQDPENRNGLGELVMRMMANKTEHVPDEGFHAAIDRVGGTSGCDATLDDTEFYAQVPTSAVETALWILSDQMGFFKPAVTDAAIAHRVQILAAERGQRVGNAPMGLAGELVPAELYPPGHPYRHVTRANDAAGLASLGAAELDAFVDRYFVPSNAVLVISGDLKSDDAVALAKKWFGAIPAGEAPSDAFPSAAPLQHEVHLDIEAPVERPVVQMTWLAPADLAPDAAELDVLANILHGMRIARLSWELITNRKVAGEIVVQETPHRRGSTFRIMATATPKHTAQQVADSIDAVLRELQTTQAPASDDMEGGLASALMDRTLSMEGSLYRARQFSLWAIHAGTADYWSNDMHRYETDPSRVQQAAIRWLRLDQRVVTFVTPSKTAPVAGKLVRRTVK